ncbi:PepSY domain-containing protein [Streptomyces sp. NPDC056600]|uniref:PepSY domain-containing protein n=1 Tax=Streptomyces sp. NPDC056600 TaxID=3345874 RepID=UPI003675168D
MKRNIVVLAAAGAITTVAVVGTALAVDGPAGAPARSVSAAPAGTGSQAPPTTQGGEPGSAVPTDPAATGTPAWGSTGVTRERAVALARADVGGGRVLEVEQEAEHGRAVWSVRILRDGMRYRVDVDRATGLITRTEGPRASDDGGGRKASADDHGRDDDRADDHGGDDDRTDDDGGRHGGRDDGDDHDVDDDHGGDRGDRGGDGRGGDDDRDDDH